MNKVFVVAALTAAGVAGSARAQEFKGAEIGSELLVFTEEDEVSSTTYRGSAEMGVFGSFGLAADVNAYDFGEDDGARNVTIHALYDALELATVGVFVARDFADDAEATTFGVEAGRSFGSAGGEVYAGLVDDEGEDLTLFGLDGAYDLRENISVTGSLAVLAGDGGNISRAALGGEYRFGEAGPVVYGEIGRLDVEDGASDLAASATYIGVGARIAIGPNRGTTFESRGLFELLSGL